MSEPNTPADVYKAIIDQLVNETRRSGSGSRVAKRDIYSNAPADREFNEFIRSLTPQQRGLVARMLQEERDGAIHDVLAALTWWIVARAVGLTYRGSPMSAGLSGMGLHGDYIGRRDGWEWPTNDPGKQADASLVVDVPVRPCAGCGRPIPPERLQAVPGATRCMACQQRAESAPADPRVSEIICPRCAARGLQSEMVWRTARDPTIPGYFLGCSRFPECRYVER